MQTDQEDVVSRFAISGLIEENISKLTNTIAGMKHFLFQLDASINKLFPTAVSVLGTANPTWLTDNNMITGHNVMNCEAQFKDSYKGSGKKFVDKYLAGLLSDIEKIRVYIASKMVIFGDAERFLVKYRHVVSASKRVCTGLNPERTELYDEEEEEEDNDEVKHKTSSFSHHFVDSSLNRDGFYDDSTEAAGNAGAAINLSDELIIPDATETAESSHDAAAMQDGDGSFARSESLTVFVPDSALKYDKPEHEARFKILMGKTQIRNTHAKRELKKFVFQKIEGLYGDGGLSEKKEVVLEIENYYLRLNQIYNMGYEKFRAEFEDRFKKTFDLSKSEWKAITSKASQERVRVPRRPRNSKQSAPFQLY